jgi:nucleoside-diphosphate-sugar epimerase
MALHVVVGAGAVGTATAIDLAGRGHQVRVLSRSGSGPTGVGIESLAVDATDDQRLSAVSDNAAAIYNCANPPYDRWDREWPPLATSILAAAETTGAVLVTMSNLYSYGPVDHPITEQDPLAATGKKGRVRAAMWEQALAAHTAGTVRATEARASDYFGPRVRDQGHIGERTIPAVLAGRSVRVLGNPDVPHSWTYVPDIGAALATLRTDERAWGRPWHVPTNPPLSQREVLSTIARIAGAPAPKIQALPGWALRVLGVFVPFLRELEEVRYQFDGPFVIDSTDFWTTFEVGPTPMEHALAATVSWWLEQKRSTA